MGRLHCLISFSILGIDEIATNLPAGTSHLVSLVDPDTILPKAVAYAKLQGRCTIRVHDALEGFPDKIVPSRETAQLLCDFADSIRDDSVEHLLFHCEMGRSRSAAAAAIVLTKMYEIDPRKIFAMLREVRDPIWPNNTLIGYGDQALGLNGKLLEACEETYRHVQRRHPHWVADPTPENL